ncbi:VOC family protein [Halosolutus halophilus]|uniref:VOC family protein n=1 Tax=Halosolutus halophilus TaxID=1552990 RepID=UPI002234F33D|nr:VOC family protein [Halosolutus halophilus]
MLETVSPEQASPLMEPRITVITLGVSDLETSLDFYHEGLGWPTEGIVGTEFEGGAVAFFPLNNGLQLALYPKQQIAEDANVEEVAPSSTEFTLGHNVASKEAVDAVLKTADEAGAEITDPPRDREWGGYSGHFLDPDDHLWEVVWNPQFEIEE